MGGVIFQGIKGTRESSSTVVVVITFDRLSLSWL